MKKRKNPKGIEIVPIQNPVAKYAHLFNKVQTFCDKSKYSRKAKHTSLLFPKQDFRHIPCRITYHGNITHAHQSQTG